MNNDKDTCQQMVSIAELASNQHNDRRQITFRIAIGYTTLLALGIYLNTFYMHASNKLHCTLQKMRERKVEKFLGLML